MDWHDGLAMHRRASPLETGVGPDAGLRWIDPITYGYNVSITDCQLSEDRTV